MNGYKYVALKVHFKKRKDFYTVFLTVKLRWFGTLTTAVIAPRLCKTLLNMHKPRKLLFGFFAPIIIRLPYSLTDNGVGFNFEAVKQQPQAVGVGLKSILNRAKLIGATITITNTRRTNRRNLQNNYGKPTNKYY